MPTTKKKTLKRSPSRRSAKAATGRLIVELANGQRRWKVDAKRLRAGVQAVLAGEGIEDASISLAVVNDAAIHELNLRYLEHDEPTDVISFALNRGKKFVDGQIVVSADTAATAAKLYGWKQADELLLYVIHGTLHLVGYDDLKPQAKRTMRQRERHYLAQFGLKPRYTERAAPGRKNAQS